MYICLDCEELFDEPKSWEERHGLDYPPYEVWHGCPFCGGGCIIIAEFCDGCNKPLIGEHIRTCHGTKYCENCFTYHSVID